MYSKLKRKNNYDDLLWPSFIKILSELFTTILEKSDLCPIVNMLVSFFNETAW